MDSQTNVAQLLTEIRDNQRKQIEAYETVTKQSLEMQRRAVERQDEAVDRQKQITTVYFRSLVVGAALLVGIVILMVYLLRLI